MRDHLRRHSGCLWQVRWLLPLVLAFALPAGAGAEGQHEAALEAMQPPAVTGPVLINRIMAPDFGRVPNPPDKARLRATPRAAQQPPAPATDASALPATPANPVVPAPAPTAPGPVEATVPPPPGTPTAGPGPLTQPGTPADAGAGTQAPLPLENPEQVKMRADTFKSLNGATTGEGNVELRYQDLTIHSYAAHLDKDRVWGDFSGNVEMQSKLYRGTSDELRMNLETDDFSARRAAFAVDPEYFNGNVLEPIYVRAAEVVGRPDRVQGREGLGTSCDRWPDPHWLLQSDRVTLVPDNRVTFHRPALYMFGHRLLRYPWDLTLSLKRSDNRFLPEVGQNQVEGYYAKFAYGYTVDDQNTGFLRLHLTQKRGIGVGFDHTLDAGEQYAELSVFTEPDQGSLTGRLLYRGQYGKPFSSNLSLNYQDNSGYGYSSQSLSSDLTLRYDTTTDQTSLGLQHSLLTAGDTTSRRLSSDLNYRHRIGASGQYEIQSTYHSSEFSAAQPADEELETQLTWRQDFKRFAVNLNANRRFDVDGSKYTGDDSFYTISRLPDLTLTTDSARLGKRELFNNPFDATLYFGYFDQQPDDLQTYRTGLDFRLPGEVHEYGKHASLRTSARFRQLFYQDAAQWIAEGQAEYRLQLPGFWQTRLSFQALHPEGFATMRFDLASPMMVLYFQAVRLQADRMRVDITCGRDFENGYYHDAVLRSEFMFSSRNRLELQTGYSLQYSQFRPLNMRWIYATPRSWWSALTVNYNLDQSELTNVSLDVDWSPSDRWRVQFLGGSTDLQTLDQADVRITRDLHCMLAQLTYSHTTHEIRLGLGIKAFPSSSQTFGVSSRGQYFESNFGDTY